MSRILNLGSLNIDEVYSVERFVKPGETVSARKVEQFPGGKGLNQSVAAARAGGQVWHAGKIGRDGAFLKEVLEGSGVHTEYVGQDEGFSGKAVIQVEDSGENCILLYQGANFRLDKEEVEIVLRQFSSGDFLILQNEVNLVKPAIVLGKELGLRIVFNPSPAAAEILSYPLEWVNYLLFNEVEGEFLTGETDPAKILDCLGEKYRHCCLVLTLGKEGSWYHGPQGRYYQPAFPVETVDTTGAGDTFTGYFIAGLSQGMDVKACLRFASRASALAVSRMGASVSIPWRREVEEWEKKEEASK